MDMALRTGCQNRQASVPPLYTKGERHGSLKLQSYEPHALLNSVLPFFLMPDEDLTAKRSDARTSFLSWFILLVRLQQTTIRPTSLRWIMRRIDRFFFYGLLTEGDDPLVRLEYKDDVFESQSLEVLFTPQDDAWVPLGSMHPSHLRDRNDAMDGADGKAGSAMNDDSVRRTKRSNTGETLKYSIDMHRKFIASHIRSTELQYQADWDDYERDSNFYPASTFREAAELLGMSHFWNPHEPGLPIRLRTWLLAEAVGEVAPQHRLNNVPERSGRTATEAQATSLLPTSTAELMETTSQWRGTIKADATDPYRNYEERKLQDVVAVLVHKMAHALLSAFVCGCDSCDLMNLSTDSILGQTSHGIVFRRLIAAMETVIRSWNPSLSIFTVPNHQRKRDLTDAELKRSRAAWEFELELKAQRRS